jgi:hypothetical protein
METTRNTVRPVVLTCWKDIAQYMGKGVRTVQRWEREFALPIRRPNGATGKSTIMALTSDLDAWLRERWSGRVQPVGEVNGSPSLSDLNNQIRASHHLREANQALVHEISMVLHALVRNCDQLIMTQQDNPAGLFPPPAINA